MKSIRMIHGVLAVIALAIAGCEADDSELGVKQLPSWDAEEAMIYFGSPPNRPEHDATISVHYDYGWSYSYPFCSGTFIFESPNYGLTAGHCMEGQTPATTAIKFGDNGNQMAGNIYQVSVINTHPSYNGWNLSNDIALMRFTGNVSYTNPVMPLPNSVGLTNADVGSTVNIAGFGEQENGNSGILEQVDVNVQAVWSTDFMYDQGNGGGNGNGGPCYGDSGGPAFKTRSGTPYVAGVTSSGDQNCNDYGYSTKVNFYEGWIESTTGHAVEEQGGGGGPTQELDFSAFLAQGDRKPHHYWTNNAGTHSLSMTCSNNNIDHDLYLIEKFNVGYSILTQSADWFTCIENLSYYVNHGGHFIAGVDAYSGSTTHFVTGTVPQ